MNRPSSFGRPARGRSLLALGLATLLVVVSGGCQRESAPESTGVSGATSDASADGPPRGIECRRADEVRRSGRRVLRGKVLVPVLASEETRRLNDAEEVSGSGDERTDASTPADRRRERSAEDLEVRLTRRGHLDESLASTRTNFDGEWCFSVPETFELGPELIAAVQVDDVRLRRSLVAPLRQMISVRSEALARLLDAHEEVRSHLSRAGYLNLHAIASTAVDLLEPVEWQQLDSLERVLERMTSTLADDDRVQSKLGRIGSGGNKGDVPGEADLSSDAR